MYIQSAWDCYCGKWNSTMPIGLTIESIASRRPAFFLSVVDSPIGFIPNGWWIISIRRSFPTQKSSLIHHPKNPKPSLFFLPVKNWRSLPAIENAVRLRGLLSLQLARSHEVSMDCFGKSYGWHLHKKHRKNIEQFWLGLLVFHGFPLNRAKEPGFFHDIFAT